MTRESPPTATPDADTDTRQHSGASRDPGVRGMALLRDPVRNKGTAFTEDERDALGLRGLLPPRVFSQDQQVERVLYNFSRKPSDLERYIFLTALHDRNEKLFYRTVIEHIDLMMPIIYTPTVGEACRKFAHIFRQSRGLYVSAADRGRVAEILRNWPHRDVAIIVVTDGERILGLGDLGANGMGIPIGKLALYTACAGIDPRRCLPVMLDVGTDNPEMLDDPLYIGLNQKRLRGPAYDELVEEFVTAVQEVFPRSLIQFEDFITDNAFALLERYRDRVLCFNDDIQGTAGVVLAGVLAAMRIIDAQVAERGVGAAGRALKDKTILFVGAGSAATGIADLVAAAMAAEGISPDEARKHIWLVDSRGLVVASRRDSLAAHKVPYAHEHDAMDLIAAVKALEPDVVIGATGRPGAFSQELVELLAAIKEHPVLFALSNPTSKAECTAEQAYTWSAGKVVFASGSPFAPVELDGRTHITGQGNNAYIFPGIGLGAVASGARRVTDEMFLVAARALAARVDQGRLDAGALYPPLSDLREASIAIAVAVARCAFDRGLASATRPASDEALEAGIRAAIYRVEYE